MESASAENTQSAILNLRGREILNATCGESTGKDALEEIIAVDQWKFDTISGLPPGPIDFPDSAERDAEILFGRARQKKGRILPSSTEKSGAQTDEIYRFSIFGERVEADLSSADRKRIAEEFDFLDYYGDELSSIFRLGQTQSLLLTESGFSFGTTLDRGAWRGVFQGSQSSVDQLKQQLSEQS